MQTIISVIMLIGGFVLLVKGADWFVEGASDIAKKFNVSQLVIGLTVVAMGTSLPEAAISISAAFKGSAGIAIGNILGSNIMNIALILGITALITPLAVQKTTKRYEIPIVMLSSVILAIVGLNDNIVARSEGIILLAIFIMYLFYTFRVAAVHMPEDTPENEELERSIIKILTMTVIGGLCVALGANLTVDGASDLARMFGISENVIGLTIVAFGTSLPELVTCVTAGLKKEADIAIGNIVGSNIFNILFVIGAAATVHPVPYGGEFLRDTIVCIGMPVLLWLLVHNKDNSLKRWGGVILLAVYACYFLLFNVGFADKLGGLI